MAKAIWLISYKLKKGASVQDFLIATEKLNNEIVSKEKGYISWKQLNDGDTWVDLMTWETLEDAKNFENGEDRGPLAMDFYSFINFNSIKSQHYTIEKDYR